ncbi:CatB-related O-acetyltransferase [Shimia sediminis]|uniref:CatB-related O-acetyltransferase n=1 Tax=Shimia sediminis TaxID=2497945 RepID=UPI0027B8F3BA|nr:CatB-related O-acetyltransferase [Shimia sediminis]
MKLGMSKKSVSIRALKDRGIEVLNRPGLTSSITLPTATRLEAPSSLKWTQYEHSLHLGAFSYQVSGYCFAARIGRYCSFGEEVQIGRQNHPMDWVSTNPSFYAQDNLFNVGNKFEGANEYKAFRPDVKKPPTQVKVTHIGHDVWIGHGAYVAAGVTIGQGAVVGAHSVVTKDVPPYAVVAGNPAVIKRYRIDPLLISPMLRCQWWQFAPWQLQHLDPTNLHAFVPGVVELQKGPRFEPTIIDLSEASW